MTDFVFTNALWELDRANWDDGDASTLDIRSMLMDVEEVTEADLVDHADIAALIAATGNTEATAVTSYARFSHGTAAQARTVDNTNNRVDFDLDDAGFGTLGNGVNASIESIITMSFDTSDALSEPVSHHDLSFTTDGSAVTISWDANGVFKATNSLST
jgi:hypothetical protein